MSLYSWFDIEQLLISHKYLALHHVDVATGITYTLHPSGNGHVLSSIPPVGDASTTVLQTFSVIEILRIICPDIEKWELDIDHSWDDILRCAFSSATCTRYVIAATVTMTLLPVEADSTYVLQIQIVAGGLSTSLTAYFSDIQDAVKTMRKFSDDFASWQVEYVIL